MERQTNTSRQTLRIREDLSTENRILLSGWAVVILKGLEFILPHVSISVGIGNRVGIKVRIKYCPMGIF